MKRAWLMMLVAGVALAGAARAEDNKGEGKVRGDLAQDPLANPELRAKIMEKFDANKDGQLDEAERVKAREAMRERWQKGQAGGGGGILYNPETRERLKAMADTNKDGQISEEERLAARQKMLEKFDTNKDGQIDEAERAKMYEGAKGQWQEKKREGAGDPKPGDKPVMMRDHWKKLADANKDGEVSQQESEVFHKKLLEKFDTNKDGQLDDQERARAREIMLDQAGEGEGDKQKVKGKDKDKGK